MDDNKNERDRLCGDQPASPHGIPEEAYRIHFSLTNEVIYVLDSSFRVMSVSPGVAKVLGFRPEELTGRPFQDLGVLHPDDLEKAVSDTLRVLSGENIESSIYRFITKEGALRFGEVSGVPLVGDGKNMGVISVARDVTERILAQEELRKHHDLLEDLVGKRTADLMRTNERLRLEIEEHDRALAALRDSEEKYRLLVENVDEAIIVAQDGMLRFVNPKTVELTGYSQQELTTRPFEFLIHPQDRAMLADRHERRMKGEESSGAYSVRIIDRQGRVKWLEVNAISITWNGRIAALTFLVDITERKRAAEALQESEARYHAIVDAFDGMIYVCSQDYRIEFMNRRLIGRTGYDGTGDLCYKVLHDRDQICPWCVNERVWAGETVRWEIESPKDNRWFYVSNSPIHHPDGTMSKQSLILDITEWKRAEDELKKHRDHLEELVGERTLDLTKAYEQLKIENEARKSTENALRSREAELSEKQNSLEEMNAALKVLLKQREADRSALETNVLKNIKASVLPYIDKLRSSGLRGDQMACLSEIDLHLQEVTSSYIRGLSSEYLGLSPSEIQVALLIREGRSSKEISELLSISLNTVHYHRYHIRKKTGVKGRKINLRAYLDALKC